MADQPTAQQTWFAHRKWGVFFHYLDSLQNGSGNFHNTQGYRTDWNDCVNALDVALLARQLHEAGAGYLMFTLQQGSRYLCAPNALFDAITGYAPGEACSTRDLIADLADALAHWDIPLFLYFTGDGPRTDPRAMAAFYGRAADLAPGRDQVHMEFVRKWSAVLREYALRYGDRIAGWWVDGLYDSLGYTPELITPFRRAAREGNPNALFSANYYGCLRNGHEENVPGVGTVLLGDFYHTIAPPTPLCDYTAGEVVTLDVFPTGQLVEQAQAHILSFLGIPRHPIEVYGGWGARGCKYSTEYLMQYVRQVNACGGVVTLDACLYRDGRMDPDQLRVLKMLGSLRRGAGG